MNRVLKCIERMMQILAVIGGIWTTIEMVRMHVYKKKLKEKADEYLDDELALEGDVMGSITVYSPTLEGKQQQVAKLAGVTAIIAIVSIVLNLINRDDRI